MNTHWARRYHWLGRDVASFICEPHKAICCDRKGRALNMVAEENKNAQEMSAQLATAGSDMVISEFRKIKSLDLSDRHAVNFDDINPKNLTKIFIKTYGRQPEDFGELLGMEGVGPKTIRALALISEIIYGKAPSFKDPVRFSFAHGGKDGHPYSINRSHYDLSIQILKDAVDKANISRTEKLAAIKRLAGIEKTITALLQI